MSTTTRILSLGAGVQSTALLLMSIRGELPRIDHAIFADTGWEPAAVYKHLEWLKGEAATACIPLDTVVYRNLRSDLVTFRVSKKSGNSYTHVPLYVRADDGKLGMLGRTCTDKYKIGPVTHFITQQLLKIPKGGTLPTKPVVDVWLGITWDEKHRAKPSPVKWKRHVHPFCCSPEPITSAFVKPDGTPRIWNRSDCTRWLASNYPGLDVPRSACLGCPFRSNAEWRRIRDDDADGWADALKVDAAIREQKSSSIDGTPYLHRSGAPLKDADLENDDSMWDGIGDNECLGMCGV